MNTLQTIPVICISGGPCAGKTTVLSFLEQKLNERGYTVVIVNEAATEFKLSGLKPKLFTGTGFQSHLLQHIIETENRWKKAVTDMVADKKVIICDRGAMDAAAYVSTNEFNEIINSLKHTVTSLRDERYDAIIFLRSVAYDMPEVYTRTNNAAREETVEEAKEIDHKTLSAWIGHPHLRIIGNAGGIETKLNQTLQAVCGVLGIPEPREMEQKFLLPSIDLRILPKGHQSIEVSQQYLISSNDTEERVRTWETAGAFAYYHTQKKAIAHGIRLEWERRISKQEYLILLQRRDPSLGTIQKTRHCFVWENQCFELDVFKNPKGLILLEAERFDESHTVTLPPFLMGAQDVTGITQYSNLSIAKSI